MPWACFRFQREGGIGLKGSSGAPAESPDVVSTLLTEEIHEDCTDCGTCAKFCAFLSHYGTPKAIVTAYDLTTPGGQKLAYECSL